MKKLFTIICMLLPVALWAQTTAEPYAVLSEDGLTVTFYYDDQKASRGGMEINSRSILRGEKNPYGTAVTAIIDDSFANYTTLRSTSCWFMECNNLTEIRGIANLNTANVTGMSYMFSGCSGLTSLDVSGFNTANVTNMLDMFSGCSGLTSLDVSGFNTANVTYMSRMFSGCSGLTNLDLSGFNTANVTEMGGMFDGCSGLTSLDVRGFKTANVMYMSDMFYGCSGLTSLDVSGFNTANVTGMSSMFSGCRSLTSLDLSGFNTANVTYMYDMFAGCRSLTSLDVSGFKTDNVTDMSGMFERCSGLTSLDLSGFNTANVTRMYDMFSNCSGLTSLDVSGFNTANVTDMSSMFNGCSGLTSLDVSGFKTDNVTDMGWMFSGCSGLTSLDVSGFNTANVTDMGSMFDGCSGLTSLDLSGFNTANVTDMAGMFYGCSGLTSLDVSGLNTANVTDMRYMFQGCSGLTKIFAGDDWNTALVTYGFYMFTDCTSLVGGAGTAYDANHTDHTYAHIDGGTANPGYFTAKNAAPKQLEAPIISVSDNVVTISSNNVGASIYYTIDGSLPTTSSTSYTEPITVTQNCCIQAIATMEGMENSDVSTWEVSGLTTAMVLPAPVVTANGNVLSMMVPTLGQSTNQTGKVAVDASAWGCSDPKIDLSGEWTCSVLDDSSNVSETYLITLRENGHAEFQSSYLEESSWSYNGSSLRIRHDILYTQEGAYQYYTYLLTPTNPSYPTEFTGEREHTVGNWMTENNHYRNVRLNYNGQSLPVERVTTGGGNEAAMAIVSEGDSEKTGELMLQTITGLENGYYRVNLYAKSIYSSAQSMADDVTYIFANDTKLFIPLEADQTIHGHNVYNIGVEVTDGTLRIGLGKEKTGANWHAIQIESLHHYTLSDTPMENVAIYYTTNDSVPTTSSTPYVEPFTVTGNCTVKAFAVAPGYNNSRISSFIVDWFATLQKGDANGDGVINIADAVATVTNILGEPTEEFFSSEMADMNDDGVIDIFDVTMIVNAVFETASPSRAYNDENASRRSIACLNAEKVKLTTQGNLVYMDIEHTGLLTAFQFDITVPEGIALQQVQLASGDSNHQLSFRKLGNGQYRVIGLSMTNEMLSANDGHLLKLRLTDAVHAGDVQVDDVIVVGRQPDMTAIQTIEKGRGTVAEGGIYDLKGRYVGNDRKQLTKGVYVIDQKKVFIK